MFYLVLTIIFIVLLILIGVLFTSYFEYKKKHKYNDNFEEEHQEYQKEKFKKIKAQYYRGIEIEQDINQNYNIVGFVEPKGRWTKMVIMRNLKYMTTLKDLVGNNFGKMGIWQLKVKAQSLISHGFHRGKGR